MKATFRPTVQALVSSPVPAVAGCIRQARQEVASVEAGAGVAIQLRAGWIDTETGIHGLRGLVLRILSEAGCAFLPFTGINRESYVCHAMRSDELVRRIRQINGWDKYPTKGILDRLLVFVHDGWLGKIQLTNSEDPYPARGCKRPRTVYFLHTEPVAE